MTEKLTSTDPIETWRKVAERAENPATWRVGDELLGPGYVRGWVREQGRTAVLIEHGRSRERLAHHAAAARRELSR